MRWLIPLFLLLAADVACADKKPSDPKSELTRVKVQQIAFEAYPQWSAAHPDKACPAKLEELAEYIANFTGKDPWGHAYKIYCGASLPKGAKGFAASSAGADGKDGTADDIRSWD